MEKGRAYTGLADWFEYFNDDCGYEEWSQYLIARLREFSPSARTGLDVGCGSGYFTRAFTKAGYQTTGLDVSAEMLNKAEELSLATGVRARYLLGDAAKFSTPEKFDFATAINDCINYISKEKLLSAFRNVHSALHKNGTFFFDISSPRKFREKIANTVCADDRDDATYLSFNSVVGDVATMDVTLFVRRGDGAFDRFDETHTQYIYQEEEILSALEKTGFELLRSEGHLGADKTACDRISFYVKRR